MKLDTEPWFARNRADDERVNAFIEAVHALARDHGFVSLRGDVHIEEWPGESGQLPKVTIGFTQQPREKRP